MSNSPMPTIPATDVRVKRSDAFDTIVKRTPSGRTFRTATALTPNISYELAYNGLRTGAAAELQNIVAHFAIHKGRLESFPFVDPDFTAEALGQFGTGDGVTRGFQLLRHIGAAGYPVFDVTGLSVYVNAVLTTAYTQSSGLVTFNAAPTAGALLAWSGTYTVRVYYGADNLDLESLARGIYKSSGVIKLDGYK